MDWSSAFDNHTLLLDISLDNRQLGMLLLTWNSGRAWPKTFHRLPRFIDMGTAFTYAPSLVAHFIYVSRHVEQLEIVNKEQETASQKESHQAREALLLMEAR